MKTEFQRKSVGSVSTFPFSIFLPNSDVFFVQFGNFHFTRDRSWRGAKSQGDQVAIFSRSRKRSRKDSSRGNTHSGEFRGEARRKVEEETRSLLINRWPHAKLEILARYKVYLCLRSPVFGLHNYRKVKDGPIKSQRRAFLRNPFAQLISGPEDSSSARL